MSDLLTYDALIALVTLTAMEIVLGIDNLVFITILTGKLPPARRSLGRRIGLGLALGMRIALLLTITWIMGLTTPLFRPLGHPVSGRDLILMGGGLFLIFKATREVYEKLEVPQEEAASTSGGRATLGAVLIQIMLIDVVFSLDSVITAVGMADHVVVMVTAMVIAMVIMIVAINGVGRFIERHPSIKMLALAFLLLIGVMLVAEGMGRHVEKGYIYVAMAFSLFVELLNMRYQKRRRPGRLHRRSEGERG
ncbi:MAG TPA: TerC family protein [Methylomirabilota bacterium]|jgi:predicted tellurium resistance membrane protein TerC|nr:TerC family protein [Methylomirabilota bacterium]